MCYDFSDFITFPTVSIKDIKGRLVPQWIKESHLFSSLYLDYFLAQISDISEVQQLIGITHEIFQQVVLTQ
jgi:hypothetical protein